MYQKLEFSLKYVYFNPILFSTSNKNTKTFEKIRTNHYFSEAYSIFLVLYDADI